MTKPHPNRPDTPHPSITVNYPYTVNRTDTAIGTRRRRKAMSRVIAVVNQKGGVGKTTATVNVAACAAEIGRRVLIIDLDQQASSTRWLRAGSQGGTVLDLLTADAALADLIAVSAVAGVDVVPSGEAMYGAEKALAGEPGAETLLRTALDNDVAAGYDLVLIDCPPTLSVLVVNAMVAAAEILVPVTMGALQLEGVAMLTRTVELVAKRLNPALHITAVLPLAYDGRQVLSRDVLTSLTARFGPAMLPAVRSSVRVGEAPAAREPLTTFAPREAVTDDFRAATHALLEQGDTR